uniref:Photosystem II reaction center protein Y n=1 Tax=Cyanidiaceae sp. MX-AZ01 TaxID=1503164 RepID=A0A060AE62_9RHOD|nr:photosystem II protein Y [Cyanidiaceae sp. MX-AZ01]
MGGSVVDTRLFIVLLPILAAASWAIYNIGKILLLQFTKRS